MLILPYQSKFKYLFIGNYVYLVIALLGLFTSSFGQTISITGQVIDATDEQPLIGASILVKGTSNGVITDVEGKYTISVNEEDAILEISFIGFVKQEIGANGLRIVNVALLQDITSLDEVIVVGYGTQKKSDVTGSIVVLKSAEILKQPGYNATQSIQGKAAGVQIINTSQPGTGPQIRIRGTGTVLGGANPIFVVDGVITTTIDNINSNDIESINILKDASASAIYGVRGANGVVIITTKSGTEGPLKVNYSGYVGMRNVLNKVAMADTRLYADFTNRAQLRAGGPARFLNIDQVLYFDGKSYNTDWFDAITRTAYIQNHSISLMGGTAHNSVYLGINYYLEEGILQENDVERVVIRLNDTYSINDFVKASASINYSFSDQNGAIIEGDNGSVNTIAGAFTSAYTQAPYVPVYDANERYGYSDAINNVGNPVASLDYNNDKFWNNRFQGSGAIEVDFLENFNFSTSLSFDLNLNRARSYTPHYQIDPVKQFTNKSTLHTQRNINSFWNWNNFLKYNYAIGQHSFSVLAGVTTEEVVINRLGGSRDNIPNVQRLWYLGVGDVTSAQNNQSGDRATRVSYVGRVNYSYNEKYLFTGTLRREGSSKFAEAQRFGIFPAIGIGWRISEERFLKDADWIDHLKLRASWGRIGNDRIPSNEFAITIGASQDLGAVFGSDQAFHNGATVTQLKDESLTWETVVSTDIGIEFGFLEGRLSGEIDYYNKLTKDVLINKPTGAGGGDVDLLTNAGEIRNSGVELLLNYRGSSDIGLKYRVGGNITFNNNNVVKLTTGSKINGGDLRNGRFATRTIEGEEVASFWVYKTDGIYQNQAAVEAGFDPNAKPGDLIRVDVNDDGRVDNADRVFIGSFAPKAYFGINLSLEYKSFDFSIDSYGNIGNKIFNGLKYRRFGGENITADLEGFWTPENPNSVIPGASNDIPEPSDYFIEDGDFFRINNLTIGYSLATSWTNKLRLYASAQNPFMWQKYSGYTPELPRGVLDSGIELDIYPSVSTFLIGVNIGI